MAQAFLPLLPGRGREAGRGPAALSALQDQGCQQADRALGPASFITVDLNPGNAEARQARGVHMCAWQVTLPTQSHSCSVSSPGDGAQLWAGDGTCHPCSGEAESKVKGGAAGSLTREFGLQPLP